MNELRDDGSQTRTRLRIDDVYRLLDTDRVRGRQAGQERIGDEKVNPFQVAVVEPLHLSRPNPQHGAVVHVDHPEVDLAPP
ncbi:MULTISPECIES: hypothetical protein [Curtobacterium]|uniref:hypothetical protein n=1 Tax=Curtobacterium TaxID=2034 RepID=UPI001AD9DC0A|nr:MULTISPECIES: hypothetical protein [Curtobacterium]MBO9038315.1 hypothetical protein [Curtobacterium flaccumfaciens pv. flaccumfaciens]MDT0232653.1 hypothetical protein [Curtobacterium sp. BRB10]